LLDRDMHWRVVPGTFDIMVGSSSADIALKAALEVKAPNKRLAGVYCEA
jgi:beta-glucosidase